MSKARDLADFISDSTIETAELADNAVTSAKLDETDSYTVAGLTATTADINGGTIDGVTIGGASAGAGTFTTITGSGDMAIDTDTLFVDAGNNAVGINNSSPTALLHVAGMAASSATAGAVFEGAWPWLKFKDTENAQDTWAIYNDNALFINKLAYADRDNAPNTGVNYFIMNTSNVVWNDGGNDQNFRVESNNNANMLFVDAGNDRIGIGTGTPRSNLVLDVAGDIGQTWIDGEQFVGQQYSTGGYRLGIITDSTDRTAQLVANAGDGNGKLEFYTNTNRAGLVSSANDWTFFEGVTINENGNDNDFRVESDSNTHALFVDAGNSAVKINTSTTNDDPLTIQANASADAIRIIGRSSGDGARIDFYEDTNTSSQFGLGSEAVESFIRSIGTIPLNIYANSVKRITIDGSGNVVFNEDSNDMDFRVESNNQANMLFVDAGNDRVGIGTSNLTNLLQVGGALGLDNAAMLAGETSGDFTITVSGLLTLNGSSWRQSSILVFYSGINGDLSGANQLLSLIRIRGLGNYTSIATTDIVGTASVSASNSTTTGVDLTFDVNNSNVGSVYALVISGGARPTLSIAG